MACQRPTIPRLATELTVAEVIVDYWRHAKRYYRLPNGTTSSEVSAIKLALGPLKDLYGDTRAVEFGPLALKVLREKMIAAGWKRTSINHQVDRIRRMFKWAAAEQKLPAISAIFLLRQFGGVRFEAGASKKSAPGNIEDFGRLNKE